MPTPLRSSLSGSGLAQCLITTLLALLLLANPHVSALHATDTITSGGDNTRSGYQPNHNMDPAQISSPTFGILWRKKLLGTYRDFPEQIYAQPLVYTPPDDRQYVYVSTQMNWVYKLDAVTGEIVVARNLHVPFLVGDLDGCNDVANCVGNTATGVIDPATNTWHLTTKTYRDQSDAGPKGRQNARYYIHALSCDTLASRPGFPIDLEGTVATNNPGRVFQAGIHHQRPALIQVAAGYVYAGFASHCVQYNFTGWLVGWRAAGGGGVVEAFAVEGGAEVGGKGGGVWMSGGGLASDGGGRLFFATGNGYASQLHGTPVPGRQPPSALEEAAVAVVVGEGGRVRVVDFFMPAEKEALDGADKDLGTSPLVLLDPKTFTSPKVPRMGVITGKSGKTYFLNLDDLGGYRTGPSRSDAVPQVTQNPNAVFAGAGSYPLEGGYVYVNVVQNPTQVFKFGVGPDGDPVFTKVAETREAAAFVVGVGHGTTTSLGGRPGTGLYWVSDVQGYNLRVYKAVPVNGFLEPVKLLSVPGTIKFSRPVFGDGRAYLTTSTGEVVGIGSPTTPPLLCAAPVDLGDVRVGRTSAPVTISCRANVDTQVTAIALGSPAAAFALSGLPALPKSVARGLNLTFQATFSPAGPGPLAVDVAVNTTNAAPGFSGNTAIALKARGVSLDPVLGVTPGTVAFNPVVVGENPNGVEASFLIGNLGEGALRISGYEFSSTSKNGPFVPLALGAAGGERSVGAFAFKNLPAAVQGNVQVAVTVTFNPQTVGAFAVYVNINSNGGTKKLTVTATAVDYPKALLEFEKPDGSGWVAYDNNNNTTAFDFGSVYQSTTRNLHLRLTNAGGPHAGQLGISVSKPPLGGPGQLISARNALDLAEGTAIPPGASASAVLFCSVPKAQVNTDAYTATATWTLNTGDPAFGHQTLRFRCTAVAEQVGPLRPDASGSYRYVGCYRENNPGRQLATLLYGSDATTNGGCQTDCAAAAPGHWAVAGTQYHRECWCGARIPTGRVEDAQCNFECAGNPRQTCGGNGAGGDGAFISLFADAGRFPLGNDTLASPAATALPPTPSHPPVIPPNFTYQGCFAEPPATRALTGKTVVAADMTLARCAGNCTAFPYFGVEYGSECYCGHSLAAGAVLAANQAAECSFPCAGNGGEFCGAGNRLDVYRARGGANGTAPAPLAPALKPAVGAYAFLGCYAEPRATTTRALSAKTLIHPSMTLELCATACNGYVYFGVEYATECYCGNGLAAGSLPAPNQGDCSFPCPGNAAEFCGAGDRLELYRRTDAGPAPAGPTHPLRVAGGWVYLGCFTEATAGRALGGKVVGAPDMSLEKCGAVCAGYTFFGVEYGSECYCGDQLAAGAVLAGDQGDCSFVCPGDGGEFCGAGNRLDLYGVRVLSKGSASVPLVAGGVAPSTVLGS